jgi:hypothetical protein
MAGGLIWAEVFKLFLVRDAREIFNEKHLFYDQGKFNNSTKYSVRTSHRTRSLLIQIKWEVLFRRLFPLYCENEKK